MSTLGDRLKSLRGTHSQRWLAEKLAIPQTTLSNYENNKSELNFAMIEAITTIFSVNTDWLLFERGPMHSTDAPAPLKENLPQRPASTALCPRCAKLEEKLDRLEEERRELNAENRKLWRENGDLRERCATLEERHNQSAPVRGFSKQLISSSSEDATHI